jgi:hypothetical protein
VLVGRRALTPRTVFMQLGGRDWTFALRVASFVERVYLLGSAGAPPLGARLPVNLRLVRLDDFGIGVPEGSVDVAFTDEALERRAFLRDVRHALSERGVLVCAAASATARELRELLLGAGFRRLRFYAGTVRLPYWVARLAAPLGLHVAATK